MYKLTSKKSDFRIPKSKQHSLLNKIHPKSDFSHNPDFANPPKIQDSKIHRKKSISPPNLWGGLHNPQPMKRSISPHVLSKTCQLTLKVVLKNHSKSQKNHKMENPIVLDSKWEDLHSEHIMWYALVYFFTAMKKSIDLKLQQKNILKHTILYVYCVDLLIWNLTQLNFPF